MMAVMPVLLLVVGMPLLQIFEVVERLFAVEDADVLRLGRGEATDGPA